MFPKDRLDKDEKVVASRRSHWTGLRGPVLVAAVTVLVVLAILAWTPALGPVAILIFMVAAVGVIGSVLQWRSMQVVLTNRRLLSKNGFLVNETFEVPLERVLHTEHHQTFIGKMLDVGCLMIETAGETGNRTYDDIANPAEFEKQVYHYIEVAENSEPSQMQTDGTGQSTLKARTARAEKRKQSQQPQNKAIQEKQNIAEEIRILKDLKEDSVISDREFDNKKSELLDKI